jgi:hypothetical protein
LGQEMGEDSTAEASRLADSRTKEAGSHYTVPFVLSAAQDEATRLCLLCGFATSADRLQCQGQLSL